MKIERGIVTLFILTTLLIIAAYNVSRHERLGLKRLTNAG
jgi:hypothetical protein